MAEQKRFYWIKLKENFFDLETIDWLIAQKNGCEYIVLYQKLCLLTANKGGNLATQVGEMIVPYDCNKIARDTKFSVDTVIIAMELFKKIGLIDEQDGILKIPYIDEIVGSETEFSRQKRAAREKKKSLKRDNVQDNVGDNVQDNVGDNVQDNVGDNVQDNVRQEIENRDKRIEIRDIDIDVDVEKGVDTPDYTDPDNIIQRFKGNILLSENQMGDLLEKMGLENFNEYVFRLGDYIKRTGHTIKNHYQTILKWYNEDRAV